MQCDSFIHLGLSESLWKLWTVKFLSSYNMNLNNYNRVCIMLWLWMRIDKNSAILIPFRFSHIWVVDWIPFLHNIYMYILHYLQCLFAFNLEQTQVVNSLNMPKESIHWVPNLKENLWSNPIPNCLVSASIPSLRRTCILQRPIL